MEGELLTDKERTEQEQAALGRRFAKTFGMRRDKEHPDRWRTSEGTKTDLGLYRTVKRMLDSGT